MIRFAFTLCICALGGGAFAEGWTPLNGSEIQAALAGATLTYDNAVQSFDASGLTHYNAGEDSMGRWRVQGDQYCSQWPPSIGWVCYDMQRQGDVLRFIGESGHTTDGTLKQ